MAADRQPAEFGARLRQAREGKGISLRVIAESTKISVRALEALERNDISQLPGGIFSRAFVRGYAVQVGLDPEETIADFLNTFPDESVVQGHPRTRHQLIEELDRERPMLSAARIVLAGVAVTAIAVYFGVAGWRSTAAPVEPVAEAAAAPSAPLQQVARQAADAPIASGAAAARALTVALEARAACTVTVSADGSGFTSHALPAGGRLEVQAERELFLSASDPSALRWSINGSDVNPLTGPVRLTPGNAGAFIAR